MSPQRSDQLLKRFRNQHANLKAVHPELRLYALIDFSAMSDIWQRQLSDTLKAVPRFPLYSDTGLDDLAESGPFLIACPEPEGAEPQALCRSLCDLTRRDHRFVSWIWAIHDIEPLINHLQTLLHARLGPDNGDAWFFFYQPAFLPVLHRELPETARHYMFGPCLGWWCFDSRGELVELSGDNLPLPTAWNAFPVPEGVVGALHRAGAPAQLRAWLKKVMPELLDQTDANAQVEQIAPLAERAFAYGITGKNDLGVYVAYGLRYGAQYDDHPALQTALTQRGNGSVSLIDTYAALSADVWQEVMVTAQKRAAEAAAVAHLARLTECGYVSLRIKIVNDTEIWRRQIELLLPGGSELNNLSLGEIQPCGFEPTEIRASSAKVPIPGTRVAVRWIGPTGMSSVETVVTGALPRAEGEGLATVTFARNWRVYVHMHAEEPRPKTWQQEFYERLDHSLGIKKETAA